MSPTARMSKRARGQGPHRHTSRLTSRGPGRGESEAGVPIIGKPWGDYFQRFLSETAAGKLAWRPRHSGPGGFFEWLESDSSSDGASEVSSDGPD